MEETDVARGLCELSALVASHTTARSPPSAEQTQEATALANAALKGKKIRFITERPDLKVRKAKGLIDIPITVPMLPIESPTGIKRRRSRKPLVENGAPKKRTAKPNLCVKCGTSETPEWRRGPDGLPSLCNACGLNYKKFLKKEAEMGLAPEDAGNFVIIQTLLN